MDTASEELSKDSVDIDVAKLESLLKLSLHLYLDGSNKDNLTCSLERYKLYRHLDAIHSASISSKSNENTQSSSTSSVISLHPLMIVRKEEDIPQNLRIVVDVVTVLLLLLRTLRH